MSPHQAIQLQALLNLEEMYPEAEAHCPVNLDLFLLFINKHQTKQDSQLGMYLH